LTKSFVKNPKYGYPQFRDVFHVLVVVVVAFENPPAAEIDRPGR